MEWLKYPILSNSVQQLLIFTGIVLITWLFNRFILQIIGKVVYWLLGGYRKYLSYEELKTNLRKPALLLVIAVAIDISSELLTFPRAWKHPRYAFQRWLEVGYILFLIISSTWLLVKCIGLVGKINYRRVQVQNPGFNVGFITFSTSMIQIFAMLTVFSLTLSHLFKFNVISVITGLGIGGLAVALAGKETLENFFGSLAILLDRPFKIGDTVKVGTVEGDVEHVGLRSTRIRTYDGSLVTLPNKKMIDSELDNLTERVMRRILLKLFLSYNTPPAKIKELKSELTTLITSHPKFTDQLYLSLHNFTELGIEVRVMFYFAVSKYVDYIVLRDEINQSIYELLTELKIEFIQPASSLAVNNNNSQ